jgi:hypothetical protein
MVKLLLNFTKSATLVSFVLFRLFLRKRQAEHLQIQRGVAEQGS